MYGKRYNTPFREILELLSSVIVIFRRGSHLLSLYVYSDAGEMKLDDFISGISLNNRYSKLMPGDNFLRIFIAVTPLTHAGYFENRNFKIREVKGRKP